MYSVISRHTACQKLSSRTSTTACLCEVISYLKRSRERERTGERETFQVSRLLFWKLLLFQALLRGALTQQSAVILVCMAIDRYVCMLHPHRYHKHSSKRVSYFVLSTLTLISSIRTNELSSFSLHAHTSQIIHTQIVYMLILS